jgi:hypothetical protein
MKGWSLQQLRRLYSVANRDTITVPPYRIWWIGLALFTPSIGIWLLVIAIFTGAYMWGPPSGWYGFYGIWLPMTAAALGFLIPILAMTVWAPLSRRFYLQAFAAYFSIFLIWAAIDVRYYHYQHRVMVPKTGCEHFYFTWYFMPQGWLH